MYMPERLVLAIKSNDYTTIASYKAYYSDNYSLAHWHEVYANVNKYLKNSSKVNSSSADNSYVGYEIAPSHNED